MKLVVGLGNPGPKYALTRHNAGFIVVDLLSREYGIECGQTKFAALTGKGLLFETPVVLLKPQTFMNLSGRSVHEACAFYKVAFKDVVVIHDDIDIESGKVRARIGGGHGGHNGIRNIIEVTGQAEFHRIKVGVGRPKAQEGLVHDWVLGPYSEAELNQLAGEVYQTVKERLKVFLQA